MTSQRIIQHVIGKIRDQPELAGVPRPILTAVAAYAINVAFEEIDIDLEGFEVCEGGHVFPADKAVRGDDVTLCPECAAS